MVSFASKALVSEEEVPSLRIAFISAIVEIFDSSFTVTTQEAVNSPSTVVAVIVADPTESPETTPSVTVATDSLSEVQVISFVVASDGVIVAVNVVFSPSLIVTSVLSNSTPVTFIVSGSSKRRTIL